MCTCGCGQLLAESHKAIPFDVQTFTCYAGRALEQKRRMDQGDAEQQKRAPGWDDGLHYYVRPVDPQEA